MQMTQELLQTEIAGEISPILREMGEILSRIKHEVLSLDGVKQGVFYDSISGELIDCEVPERFLKAISTWDSSENSLNGSVERFPGVVEVSAGTAKEIGRLNIEKQRLESAINILEKSGVSAYMMRQAYAITGHRRIHPLQAWRQIILMESQPSSIGFTVVKHGSGSEIMSRDLAIARLTDLNAEDVIEIISNVSETTKVRWCDPVSRHIRANVVWGSGENARRGQYHASLPFCVPEGCWPTKRVRFNIPRTHSERSDKLPGSYIPLPFRKGAYLHFTTQ